MSTKTDAGDNFCRWSSVFALCQCLMRAIALGWLWRHESGTYLKFTDAGAALFA